MDRLRVSDYIEAMDTLRIGSYYEIPQMDYEQPPLVTWKDFYGFRNQVIRLLSVFGTAGPLGEVDLSADEEDQPCFSPEIVEEPDFLVVDDMYNEHDKVSMVECTPASIDAVVIESLAAMMRVFPGWRVHFALGDSGVVISSDAVLVGGRRFWDCASVVELSERCQKSVDFGPSELLDDSMNQLWRSILPGGIDRTVQFPFAPSRQWAEIIRSLEAMRSQRIDGCLTSFAYDQVRHDLHPFTRRELLDRLFPDLPTFSQEKLTAAKRNIQKDSGTALADCASVQEASELIGQIWSGLEKTSGNFGRNEVVNWWADLLHEVKDPPGWLRKVLEDELRIRVRHTNPLFELSALFGLTWLGTHDIALLVDDAMATHPEWKTNPTLVKWLENLRMKRRSYPDRKMLDPTDKVEQ
jgi:hypothetical protein